jgi:hypothetical protein
MVRGTGGCLTTLAGCLTKLVLFVVAGAALVWVVMAVMNPWAVDIGGRPTWLLYWHGTGAVVAEDGKRYPLYLTFWPERPGRHNGGRREGKGWSADLRGRGYLCVAPGSPERMDVSGTMYGGYMSSADNLFSFRLLESRKSFAINPLHRGFFDVAGTWQGPELVLDRPNQQGIPFQSGMLIDHAKGTLHWADYSEFEAACHLKAAAREAGARR